jgi:hypothetical protein
LAGPIARARAWLSGCFGLLELIETGFSAGPVGPARRKA